MAKLVAEPKHAEPEVAAGNARLIRDAERGAATSSTSGPVSGESALPAPPVRVRAFWQQRAASHVALTGWARAAYWLTTPSRLPARLRLLGKLNRQNRNGFWTNAKRILFNATAAAPVARQSYEQPYDLWVKTCDRLGPADREAIASHIGTLASRPTISVIMPVYNTPEDVLASAVRSVLGQLYPEWELCIADDASTEPHIRPLLERFAQTDPRIKVRRRLENGHIAAASNTAIELATGEFLALFDHDDLLAPQALYEVAAALDGQPGADILYSDEDKIDAHGRRYEPYFKTEYSPDLMLGQNMFNHLTVYRRSLVTAVGGFRDGFEGSQDYDLALRVLARTTPDKVRHIPAVLYHWRQTDERTSFSQAYLARCAENARRAVEASLRADGMSPAATVERVSPTIPWNRVRWALPQPAPLVSVIIPTRDRAALLRPCLAGLLERTDYPRMEILVVDNGSVEDETRALFDTLATDGRVRIVAAEGPFNYSALNNRAAREARGDILLLLNNDIDVIGPDWLGEMVGVLQRPNVGIVGAKLLYGDGRVQHAGVRLGAGTFDGGPGVAGHFGLFEPREEFGYLGSLVLARDVSAVTGACLAIRRDLYERVGGLDAENLSVAFNDIDLCLKVRASGFRVVWTPFAELHHLESASRGLDTAPDKMERFHRECRFMRQKWGAVLDRDPFYNVNFNNYDSDFRLDHTPKRPKPWRVRASA